MLSLCAVVMLVSEAQSDNHKVCIAAMKVCSDLTFTFDYINSAGPYVRQLYDLAEKACNHWSDETKEAAKQALTTILNAAPQIKQIQPPYKVTQNTNQTWESLSKSTGLELVGSL